MGLIFSSFVIYKFLFYAVILYAFFRLLFFLNPILVKKNKHIKIIKRNLPILEFLIWIIFSVFAFKEFLVYNQYFAIALFVVMLVVAILSVRIFVKDFIAGIMIKSDASISLEDTITSSGYTGIIAKFNYRTLELELQNKSIVKIPYSDILDNSLIKEKRLQSIPGYTFEINCSKKDNLESIINSIKQSIVLLPWVSIKQVPEIKALSETSNTYLLELTVFAYNKEMYFKIEKFIKERFSV